MVEGLGYHYRVKHQLTKDLASSSRGKDKNAFLPSIDKPESLVEWLDLVLSYSRLPVVIPLAEQYPNLISDIRHLKGEDLRLYILLSKFVLMDIPFGSLWHCQQRGRSFVGP